jgi:phospholipid/cholesterol/gamma-HCH transport system permease protein
MPPTSSDAAAISQSADQALALSGRWTAVHMGGLEDQIKTLSARPGEGKPHVVLDATNIQALDTVGAWVLHKLMLHVSASSEPASLQGLTPKLARLFDAIVGSRAATGSVALQPKTAPPSAVESVGRWWLDGWVSVAEQAVAMLAFVGESALSLSRCVTHPSRIRWRAVAFNVRSAGVNALPIVGLLAFLLGVVVAYQSADQLRQYGANIFVADLIGVSMLREFAPLITAIIIAGRSGSAYAAQIGTMQVTEEIDAMRTLGLSPQEMLVLPKLMAMMIVMPLLTVFADVLGVFGGMVLARSQLGVGFPEFMDRLVKAIVMSTYLVGIAKAPVFGVIIVTVGCFQGFRTQGGADSVGRQTTRAVVQSIFMVIVADAVFSVIFSALNL